MAPAKRKAPVDRPATPPNQFASTSQMQIIPQPSTLQGQTPPLTPAAQNVFDRLTTNSTTASYASSANLVQRVEFQTGNGSDVLVRKQTDSEFILRGVFMIARNDFFLTPDGNYNSANSFAKPFYDVKLNCRLACPSSSTYPFATTDFPKCIDNLRSIEKLLKVDKGGELVSAIAESLGKMQFKVSHALFEASSSHASFHLRCINNTTFSRIQARPNNSEENEQPQSGADADTTTSATQVSDENADLDEEFAMETWPVAMRNIPFLEELFETHDICPLPAYDLNDKLIHPSRYEESLKGATVEAHFAFAHYFIKGPNRHVYTAIIRRMKILEGPSALPSSPFKKIRVRARGAHA